MTKACKPLRNQVYSRLLGDQNECGDIGSQRIEVVEQRLGAEILIRHMPGQARRSKVSRRSSRFCRRSAPYFGVSLQSIGISI